MTVQRLPILDLSVEDRAELLAVFTKLAHDYPDKNQFNVTCVLGWPLDGEAHALFSLSGTNWKDGGPEIPEFEFRWLLPRYHNTVVERLVIAVQKRWRTGRIRFLRMRPKTCLSWHVDPEVNRLHFPLVTNPGALMLSERNGELEAERFSEVGSAYLWQVNVPHTAINASLTQDRVHLVFNILGAA